MERETKKLEQKVVLNSNIENFLNVPKQNSNLPDPTTSKVNKIGQHSIYENLFYFIIVIANIIFMIYSVYKVGEEYFDDYFLDFYNDFMPGWSWIKRRKDVGDSEWILGMKVLNITLPILFIHLIVSEFFKSYGMPKLIELWHIVTGVFFVFIYLGTYPFLLFLVQPIVYFIVVQLKSRKLIWLLTVVFLILQHTLIDLPNASVNKDEFLDHRDKLDVTIISLAWTNLRCVNYYLDAVDNEKMRKTSANNVVKLLSYMFYLPLFYFGPIILYSDFRSSRWYSRQTKGQPLGNRIYNFLMEVTRYFFWWFIFELMHHYLYVNVLLYHSDFLKLMNYHTLYGLGYLMGQLFHVKYVIFYGISCSITEFELECPVPPNPKCISRIHLYSDMWKNFDRGLYNFMLKYIYKPCASKAGKLISSLICFTFVFIWHGLYPHVLIWSLLNYIGVSIETFGKELMKMEETKSLQDVDYNVFRRFKCLLASPLLLMSAIAFFYYHGGKDVGDIFVQKILFGSAEATILTLLVLYCFCQVCTEIERLEELAKSPLSYLNYSAPLRYCPFPYWLRKKPKRSKSLKKLDKQRELFNLLAQKNRQVRKTFYISESLRRPRSTGQININQNHINKYQNYKPRTALLDTRLYNWHNEPYPSSIGNIEMSLVDKYLQPQAEKLMMSVGENQYFTRNNTEPCVLQDEHPTKELPSQESFQTTYDLQNSTLNTVEVQDVEGDVKKKVPVLVSDIEKMHQMNPNKPPLPQKNVCKTEQSKLPRAQRPDSSKIKHRNILTAQGVSKKYPSSTCQNEIVGDNLETQTSHNDDAQDNKKNLFSRIDNLCKNKLKKRKLWNIDRTNDK